MKKYILIIMIFVVSVNIFADIDSKAGEYGFQVMKIAISPVQSALAGNGITNEKDPFRFQFFPSATNAYAAVTTAVSYNSWMFEETPLSSFAGQIKDERLSYGFGFRYLDYGEIKSTDSQGNFIGTEQPLDFIATANIGYRFLPALYSGINLNFLYEKISTSESLGFSVDFGLTYKTSIKNLDLHSAIRNLGITSSMKNEEIDLPKIFALAVTYRYSFELFDVIPEISFETMSDDDLIVNLSNAFSSQYFDVRLGYKFGHDSLKFTSGVGIKIDNISVDYTFIPVESYLNDIHMFGISYKF